MTRAEITKFQRLIWDFYRNHERDLPWRHQITPYRIVVSEIMLQQTQVERVIPKFTLFLKTFPHFKNLARAPLAEVLRVWQGLGYNRRALALKKLAETVVIDHRGRLPDDPETLRRLPGIGAGTAGSIAAFAFNKPVVFIETNIRRVFIHHFFSDQIGVNDKALAPLIDQTLDRQAPRQWYYALMDYGSALTKQIINPNRQSRHYHRQSRFAGSVRQVRGAIVRILTQHRSLSTDQMRRYLVEVGIERDIGPIVEALEREGLIVRTKQMISLVGI